MAGSSFSATVTAWVRQTQLRQEAVRKESVQRLVDAMQEPVAKGGHLPVDTGFLRASLRAVIGDQMPAMLETPKKKGGSYQFNEGEITGVIANAKFSDVITLAYTAAYARRLEYGFTGTDSLGRHYNQKGRGFVRRATQRWKSIVRDVCKEARQRAP